MFYFVEDFNGADDYFDGPGASEWSDLARVLDGLVPQLQPSDEKGKQGLPIFDPKGTNAELTAHAQSLGWTKVPVPTELQPFGNDWDAGKNAVLVEWQFSNYPFLWNNIIRSEAVFDSSSSIPPLTAPAEALVIVTKSGSIPASNSTLYFEQARAQINTVTNLGVFKMPIRLIGLSFPQGATSIDCDWNLYEDRYGRIAHTRRRTTIDVTWRTSKTKYGYQRVVIPYFA